MKKLLGLIMAFALSGCAVYPAGPVRGSVAYVAPVYVAPAPGYVWAYHAGYGWGYHHPVYGWYRG